MKPAMEISRISTPSAAGTIPSIIMERQCSAWRRPTGWRSISSVPTPRNVWVCAKACLPAYLALRGAPWFTRVSRTPRLIPMAWDSSRKMITRSISTDHKVSAQNSTTSRVASITRPTHFRSPVSPVTSTPRNSWGATSTGPVTTIITRRSPSTASPSATKRVSSRPTTAAPSRGPSAACTPRTRVRLTSSPLLVPTTRLACRLTWRSPVRRAGASRRVGPCSHRARTTSPTGSRWRLGDVTLTRRWRWPSTTPRAARWTTSSTTARHSTISRRA